jgi:hypothetical protein
VTEGAVQEPREAVPRCLNGRSIFKIPQHCHKRIDRYGDIVENNKRCPGFIDICFCIPSFYCRINVLVTFGTTFVNLIIFG